MCAERKGCLVLHTLALSTQIGRLFFNSSPKSQINQPGLGVIHQATEWEEREAPLRK